MCALVSSDVISQRIFILRGHKVMLSPHLAELYGVEVKALIQTVKRNKDRFPADFMFQLTWNEAEILKSQFVTSRGSAVKSSRSQNVTLKQGKNVKYLPYAFTEQGVAMLSSVLKSKRAVRVNIAIMRAFVKLREMLSTHKELAFQFKELERRVGKHDEDIQDIFRAIQRLMTEPEKPKAKLGFHP
ncbi:MAG: ORF6N domain-containing protein [Candidatus Omnitrophica bacterium]|nr:ORF6N domain-containing protein [Candidatus Omnitrophota bacterium]